MRVLLLSLGETALGRTPRTQGLGQGTHDAKFYPLPRSNTREEQAPARLHKGAHGRGRMAEQGAVHTQPQLVLLV